MAFDRAGAKAAGYSDAEINDYIATKTGTAVPADMPEGGYAPPTDEPITNSPWYADPLELPAMLLGGPGSRIAKGAETATESALSKGGGAAARTLGNFVKGEVEHLPVIGRIVRFGKALGELGAEQGGKKTAAEATGTAASRVARKAAPKAVAKAEEAVAEKAAPKVAKAYKPRGASGPELERRAAARAKAVARKTETKVAGTIKPKTGSAASRVAKGGVQNPSRHEVQYYSESQGKFVPIEDMHIGQLKNAINKLGRKLQEKGSLGNVTMKQFEALKAEAIHRFQQAGDLTVGY